MNFNGSSLGKQALIKRNNQGELPTESLGHTKSKQLDLVTAVLSSDNTEIG